MFSFFLSHVRCRLLMLTKIHVVVSWVEGQAFHRRVQKKVGLLSNIVASQAAAFFFFFFFLTFFGGLENIVHFWWGKIVWRLENHFFIFANVPFLVTRPLNRKHNYFYGRPICFNMTCGPNTYIYPDTCMYYDRYQQ